MAEAGDLLGMLRVLSGREKGEDCWLNFQVEDKPRNHRVESGSRKLLKAEITRGREKHPQRAEVV
jgi:hypothetical protein